MTGDEQQAEENAMVEDYAEGLALLEDIFAPILCCMEVLCFWFHY